MSFSNTQKSALVVSLLARGTRLDFVRARKLPSSQAQASLTARNSQFCEKKIIAVNFILQHCIFGFFTPKSSWLLVLLTETLLDLDLEKIEAKVVVEIHLSLG